MSMPEPPPSEGRRAAFGFIFASSVMNSISFGIMIPILPNLIKEFTGGDVSQASMWNGVFLTTWGLIQFFTGPMLGLLSDRFGRRPVLLVSAFGLGFDFILMALAPSLWWLFVGRIISGFTASSFSTANAYLADVTPPEKRAQHFGWMGSAFSFGFLFGPVIGGWLGEYSLRAPFYAAAALTLVNALYGLFILPESLPKERRIARFEWRRANALGSLKLLRSHHELLGLAGVNFLFQLAHNILPSIFVLYAGYRYGWGPAVLGWTLMLTGVSGIIVQWFLVTPVVRKVGERGAVLMGLAAATTGFVIYGSASEGWMYLCGAPVFALGSLMSPGLQGLMTRRVGPNEQGQLQGANQSLQGISSMLGPPLFTGLFAWSVSHEASFHVPGLAIYVAAGLMAAAFVLALGVAKAPRAEPVAA